MTYYFLSRNVKVFPCTNRGYYNTAIEEVLGKDEMGKDIVQKTTTALSFDPESKLMSEYNFTHLPGITAGIATYIIDNGKESNIFKCVIDGYYFELANLSTQLSIWEMKRSVFEAGYLEINVTESKSITKVDGVDGSRVLHFLSPTYNTSTKYLDTLNASTGDFECSAIRWVDSATKESTYKSLKINDSTILLDNLRVADLRERVDALDGGGNTEANSLVKRVDSTEQKIESLETSLGEGGSTYIAITNAQATATEANNSINEHTKTVAGNPHNVTAADVGLGEVENKSTTTIKEEFAGKIASKDTGFVTGDAVYNAITQLPTIDNINGLSSKLASIEQVINENEIDIEQKVSELEAIGGEPNIIEAIKVNDVKQQPSNKVVNLTVLTTEEAAKKFEAIRSEISEIRSEIPDTSVFITKDEFSNSLKVSTKPVIKQVAMTYGTYTNSNSSFGLGNNIHAWAILDVKKGDKVSLVDEASSYEFLLYKLVDGTTTYEYTLRGSYSPDAWTSATDQRIIAVARNASDPNKQICSEAELCEIIKLDTTKTTYLEKELEEELTLSRCDFGKEMPLETDYYVESDVIVCKCTVSSLSSLSRLHIFTAVGSGADRGSAYFVDFAAGTMGMFKGIKSDTDSLTTRYKKSISFELFEGHEYVIECMKKAKEHTIRITDAYTLETDFLAVMPTSSNELGEHWGKRTYKTFGEITVNSFKDYSLQPYQCRLLIIGDSFIEGATGFAENHQDRYCARMKRLLNGSCAICGFGGATTEQISTFYEAYCKTLFKPEYVLIAGGTNDNDYTTWLDTQQALITSIKAAGSIPVLVTITRRLDTDNLSFMTEANDWIRNESNELYIDINRITTLNYDGKTQNTSMFYTDKVHPLPETHALIVQKALLDVPEVFNLSSSYVRNRDKFGQFIEHTFNGWV